MRSIPAYQIPKPRPQPAQLPLYREEEMPRDQLPREDTETEYSIRFN